jgi:hypothetical protein
MGERLAGQPARDGGDGHRYLAGLPVFGPEAKLPGLQSLSLLALAAVQKVMENCIDGRQPTF